MQVAFEKRETVCIKVWCNQMKSIHLQNFDPANLIVKFSDRAHEIMKYEIIR